MPESKIEECIRTVYPNAIVNIDSDEYGFKIDVIDNFIDAPENRLRKIFESMGKLDFDTKTKIGSVETYSIEEYAAQRQKNNQFIQNGIQIPCEQIRWFISPTVVGFIACGVKDEPEQMRCESSFVLASLDKNTDELNNYGENYSYDKEAYSFISRNGEKMSDYALSHVYNLSPSFFIAPYMDKYMRWMQEKGFGAPNPYHFAFQPLPFTFAKPEDDIIFALNSSDLRQRIASTSVPSLRDRLNQYFR